MPEEEAEEGPAEEKEEKEEEKRVEIKEEIRIKDFSAYKRCVVCGEQKIPYIELEVNGKLECTCRDCYDAQYAQKTDVKCPSCTSFCGEGDNFCWKCGNRLQLICATCGSKGDPGDKYCRQCGGKM